MVASTPTSGRRKSNEYRSDEENLMAVLLKGFLFFQSINGWGLGAFVNVYLVVLDGWSPLKAAWIWFTTDLFCLACQAILGAHVDQTKNKKLLLVLLAVTNLGGGVILLTTKNFGWFIVKGILDGIHKTLLVPTVTAMTLGAVGKTRFHRKHAAVNLMITAVGTGLGAVLVGGIGYAIYPDVKNVFSIFVALGVVSIGIVGAMPSEDAAVDSNVARGRSIFQRGSGGKSLRYLTKLLVEDDDDDDEIDPKEELKHSEGADEPEATRTDDPKGRKSSVVRAKARDGNTSEDVGVTPKMTVREMLADPTRRTSIICLFLVFASFHLVNATVLPLLGQYLGKTTEDDRNAFPILTGLMVVTHTGVFGMNWYLKGNLRKVNYRTVLLFGCGALALRLLLITLLVNFATTNLWAIGATNLLDGIGAGSLALMLALYSHLLSRQTGHYNLNMAVVSTGNEIGGALSVVLGGALADLFSYEVAFLVLTILVVLPVIFSFGISTPSLYGPVARKEPQSPVVGRDDERSL